MFLHFGRSCFGVKKSLSFVWLAVGRGEVSMFEKTSEMSKLCFKKVNKSFLFRVGKRMERGRR